MACHVDLLLLAMLGQFTGFFFLFFKPQVLKLYNIFFPTSEEFLLVNMLKPFLSIRCEQEFQKTLSFAAKVTILKYACCAHRGEKQVLRFLQLSFLCITGSLQ